jgi:transposase
MAWLRVRLSEAEQAAVKEELECHPNPHVRQRMLVLWLLHCKVTRQKAAEIVGVGRATVQRWVAAYRDGGLDGLRRWEVHGPESELASSREQIVELFRQQPARTVAEAAERIYQKTGVRRQPTQVRKFLKDLGLKWQRVRAIPVPPQKVSPNMFRSKSAFSIRN